MVVAVIPVLGRIPLLEYTLKRLNNIVDQIICIVERPDDRQVCADNGAFIVNSYGNRLGKKWNDGFWEAKQFNPDFVLHMSTRNWFSDDYLKVMLPIAQNYEITGMLDFYQLSLYYRNIDDYKDKIEYINKTHKFVGSYDLDLMNKNLIRRELIYWKGYENYRKGEPVGGGRLIRRDYLDRVNWNPFDPKFYKNLDGSMIAKTDNFKGVRSKDAHVLAISTNLWGNKTKIDKNSNTLYSETRANNYLKKWFPEALNLF